MTARRLKSFRQGDLAEGLGCEMLRRIAAVARVPREEDFGIDAICTLLRRRSAMLFAENTFAVQVKAASGDPIRMNEDACAWLQQLDVPLFLLTVDLEHATAEFYSYEWAVERPADLAFHKGPRKIHTAIPRRRRVGPGMLQPLISDSANSLDHRMRWLGPPIGKMALADLAIDANVERLHVLLKSWCALVAKRIYFRRFGINFELVWETNKPPRHGSLTIDTSATEVTTVLEEMLPLLLKAETALHATGRDALEAEFTAIKQCADELGVWVPGFSSRAP